MHVTRVYFGVEDYDHWPWRLTWLRRRVNDSNLLRIEAYLAAMVICFT